VPSSTFVGPIDMSVGSRPLLPRMLVAAVFVLPFLAGAAQASQLIDRNAQNVRLAANAKGQALLGYTSRGSAKHVLAWGAVNARHPTSGRPQVQFHKDYSGRDWSSFRNECRPYDGPTLAYLVTACTAPDGSYWALQSWPRLTPNLGMTPWLPAQRARELHLSHWSGPIARLELWTDWIYGGRYHHLFGRLSYDGHPVHGFTATRRGSPTDAYGRNIYLDTMNSRYGKGWRRENGFLAHNPTGLFCYGFYPFDPTKGYAHPPGMSSTPRGPGNGEEYRLTVIGPGVTPDISVTTPGLGDYDPTDSADVAYERQQNALIDSIVGVDKQCRRH
jgi:hypothetical protein